MKPFLKTLILTTAPLLAATALADNPATQPSTQPTLQPSTQPATQPLVQSPNPIVLPDGTSPQNPGPSSRPPFGGGGAVGGARF